jgi:hypothetical protein
MTMKIVSTAILALSRLLQVLPVPAFGLQLSA